MANAAQQEPGGRMDLSEHRATFSMFLKASEWGTILIIAGVALLTVTFAMGLGWFAGLLAYVAITVAAGLLMGMGPAWWGTVAVSTLALGVGGGVVALVLPAKKAALLALSAFV
jgi:hypothetical protein